MRLIVELLEIYEDININYLYNNVEYRSNLMLFDIVKGF